ncbi:MAG TPA: cupin domain-containing protein [Lacunisphaera sp.]|jgi:quercetin dioxygenase-like cupin family protein|nr:cupin domain-containing protein [Lacunisphaera sp.]
MKFPRFVLLLPLLAAMSLSGQEKPAAVPPPVFGSRVVHFAELKAFDTGVGERRDVANNPTATLERFECHISVLNPSRISHPPHTHPQEELIILREGTLDVNANGKVRRVGPGAFFFFRSNNPHNVSNNGAVPAKYFVFNFATARTHTPPAVGAPTAAGELASTVLDWPQLPVQPTKNGERREVVDSPTATLTHLECHVTTLNPGLAPHAAHHHPDEEIILVKDGQLAVTINGQTETAVAGDIAFFSSNDEHGLKNTGATPAVYYVVRVATEKTPPAAPKVATAN